MHVKTNALLNHSTTQALLRPSRQDYHEAEDYKHSWLTCPLLNSEGSLANPLDGLSSTHSKLQAIPLLRVWDSISGSKPESASGNRMRARLRRGVLATQDARKTSLASHADQGSWKNTPYISFTSSPTAAVRLANQRHNTRRGDQNLVVIDPGHRLRQGLPILDMGKETEWYGVKNPYREDYYSDHYLCLWEVTPTEVVGTWSWDDLRKDQGWYENIIMPAFEMHRRAHQNAADTASSNFGATAAISTSTRM